MIAAAKVTTTARSEATGCRAANPLGFAAFGSCMRRLCASFAATYIMSSVESMTEIMP